MPVDSFAQENTTDVILSEFEIEDIRDYAPSSSPSNLTVYKDRLYFSLESLSVFGGTTEIVALNKNNELLTIVDEEIFGGTYIDNPFDFVEDKVVYGTFDGLKATSLVDGSTTLLVPSTFVGSTPFVHSFFSFDNALYFKKYYREPPTTLCYWKTDGTLEGTVETDLCFKDEETTISEIVVSNNKLFIAVYDGLKYIIVTRDTDGTEIELPQRPASRSSFFRPYEGGAFFQTNRALYRSDGTIEGTVKVPLTDNIAKDSLTEVLSICVGSFFGQSETDSPSYGECI